MTMDITIVSKNENKLLDRQEIEAVITFDTKTPSRKEIRAEMGGKLATNPDHVVLRNVRSEFGIKRIRVRAHIYPSPDMLQKREPNYILVRDGLAEKKTKKKKAASAPAKKE